MKFYLPEEMNKCFKYHSVHQCADKRPTLFYPEDSHWYKNKYAEEVADLSRTTYSYDQNHIEEAFEQCTYPYKEKLFEDLDLYITTYPHKEHINAAATGKGIAFYGRGTQLPKAMAHYIAIHELGHVFDYRFVTNKKEKLHEYYELRNWEKEEVDDWDYDENNKYVMKGKKFQWKDDRNLPWQEKIVERFAEDFRYLFGGELAKQDYWGLHCDPPDEKIKEFMITAGQ